IVEYRKIALFDQGAFDFKALRGFDVFKVDATEGNRNATHGVAEGLRAFRFHFDVAGIYTTKAYDKKALAFHYRLGGQRNQVTQTQNRSTVRNNRYQVTFGGVLVSVFRIGSDLFYRLSHTWAVSQGQITGGLCRLGQLNADFA